MEMTRVAVTITPTCDCSLDRRARRIQSPRHDREFQRVAATATIVADSRKPDASSPRRFLPSALLSGSSHVSTLVAAYLLQFRSRASLRCRFTRTVFAN